MDELRMLVEETQEAGVIPDDQASYVQNVFRALGQDACATSWCRASKVVDAVARRLGGGDPRDRARDARTRRMPVWEGSPDNIVGIVNTKDLFHLFSLRGS